ncbi:hypothetical protein H5410_046547 [Solanum commersonii]|uniref:Uncharacterized protein n=1 Tax=Solanum commersonii TaxID=4109 RepID=A0A9J5XCJ4_SOLCO|nr:hypothetical protein H5410_046547 [Solanum commersonii]
MNKLEAFTSGETSRIPTCPPGFDQRNKDAEESLAKLKFQNEKQFASVAALSVQHQFGATYVVSSTDETKKSKGEHNPAITQEHQTNEKVAPCCATIAFRDDDLLLSVLSPEGKDQVGGERKQSAYRQIVSRISTMSPNDTEHDDVEGRCKTMTNYTKGRIIELIGDSE